MLPLLVLGLWQWNVPIFSPGGVFAAPALLATALAVIAGTLASIVGVAMAVVLVALQLIRQTYSGNAVREVLRQKAFGHTISLYLSSIAVAILALLSITDPVAPRTVALSYLALGLFLIALFALPPTVAQILGRTHVDSDRIRALVARVDDRTASDLIHSRQDHFGLADESEEEHPLFVLTEIAIRSVRDHDRVVPSMVIGAVATKLIQLLVHQPPPVAQGVYGSKWRDAIGGFLTLFRPVAVAAAEVGDQRTLVLVVHALDAVHHAAAQTRIPWADVIELNRVLQQIGMEALRLGYPDATRATTLVVSRAMLAHLKDNVPPQGDIWSLQADLNVPPSAQNWAALNNQWEDAAQGYTRILSTLAKEATERGLLADVGTIIYQMTASFHEVGTMEHLGLRQRQFVIENSSMTAMWAVIAAADKFGAIPLLTLSSYQFVLVQDLKAGRPWAKQLIRHLSYMARELARRGVLDVHMLNDLGTIGRGAASGVEGPTDDRCAEAAVMIAETIAACATVLNTRAEGGDPRIIAEAMKQLTSIEQWNSQRITRSPVGRTRVEAAIATVAALRSEKPHVDSWAPWPDLGEQRAADVEK